MKKIITLMLVVSSAFAFAQVPVVEGTYLPVGGTKFNQVWDTIPGGTMIPPSIGINQTWDYSAAFNNNSGVYESATKFANSGSKHHLFDTLIVDNFEGKLKDTISASHTLYVTIPFKRSLADSLEQYLLVTKKGLYNLGGFSHKKSFDSTLIYTDPELYVPYSVTYGDVKTDTSRYYGFANKYYYNGNYYKVRLQGVKTKTVTCSGYGTLQAPNATYNDVLLAQSKIVQRDTFYIDLNNDGNYYNDAILPFYPGYTVSVTGLTENYFIRNNTFGSSYLMYLAGNSANSFIGYGWYTQPVDTGTIKGTVFTNTLATTNATIGVAYLYRENSNFAKNDILATTPLDANGNYQFNSIPYGLYRIAIRADTIVYKNTFITYHNDSTDWLKVQAFPTFGNTVTLVTPIHLQHFQLPAGLGSISGSLGENLLAGFKVAQSNIPGVGTVVKKKPGDAAYIGGVSDGSGSYTYNNLENGQYELFVDIPGLNMACSYTFEVNGATIINGLDFTAGNYSISATNTVNAIYNTCNNVVATGIKSFNSTQQNNLQVYPNPYQGHTNIALNLETNDVITLEVYNSLGQKVTALDSGNKQVGKYQYEFSARQLNLSAGLYFLKLKTNHQQQVIKLIEQ